MSLTAVVFFVVYLGGLGTALLYPLAGVLLYILVYHLNPETQWWGESVRATGLRLSMTVAVATMIGIVLRRPHLGKGGQQIPITVAMTIALILLAWTSFAWGDGPTSRGLYQAEKFGKVLVFVLLMIRCVSRPQHYHLLVVAWIIGVFYIGYEAYGHVGVSLDGRLTQGLGGPDFNDSGSLALHLLVSLPFIGAMFFMERRWWARAFLLATGALAINAIVLTRTRSALLGIAVICIVGVLSLPRGARPEGFLWLSHWALSCPFSLPIPDGGVGCGPFPTTLMTTRPRGGSSTGGHRCGWCAINRWAWGLGTSRRL